MAVFVLFSIFGCASTKQIENSTVAPVYITNTKKFYLMSPAEIENKIAEAIELYKKSFDAYGNSIEKFKETFLADKTILQKAGVNETDISIVLDAFHMICNKSLSL